MVKELVLDPLDALLPVETKDHEFTQDQEHLLSQVTDVDFSDPSSFLALEDSILQVDDSTVLLLLAAVEQRCRTTRVPYSPTKKTVEREAQIHFSSDDFLNAKKVYERLDREYGKETSEYKVLIMICLLNNGENKYAQAYSRECFESCLSDRRCFINADFIELSIVYILSSNDNSYLDRLITVCEHFDIVGYHDFLIFLKNNPDASEEELRVARTDMHISKSNLKGIMTVMPENMLALSYDNPRLQEFIDIYIAAADSLNREHELRQLQIELSKLDESTSSLNFFSIALAEYFLKSDLSQYYQEYFQAQRLYYMSQALPQIEPDDERYRVYLNELYTVYAAQPGGTLLSLALDYGFQLLRVTDSFDEARTLCKELRIRALDCGSLDKALQYSLYYQKELMEESEADDEFFTEIGIYIKKGDVSMIAEIVEERVFVHGSHRFYNPDFEKRLTALLADVEGYTGPVLYKYDSPESLVPNILPLVNSGVLRISELMGLISKAQTENNSQFLIELCQQSIACLPQAYVFALHSVLAQAYFSSGDIPAALASIENSSLDFRSNQYAALKFALALGDDDKIFNYAQLLLKPEDLSLGDADIEEQYFTQDDFDSLLKYLHEHEHYSLLFSFIGFSDFQTTYLDGLIAQLSGSLSTCTLKQLDLYTHYLEHTILSDLPEDEHILVLGPLFERRVAINPSDVDSLEALRDYYLQTENNAALISVELSLFTLRSETYVYTRDEALDIFERLESSQMIDLVESHYKRLQKQFGQDQRFRKSEDSPVMNLRDATLFAESADFLSTRLSESDRERALKDSVDGAYEIHLNKPEDVALNFRKLEIAIHNNYKLRRYTDCIRCVERMNELPLSEISFFRYDQALSVGIASAVKTDNYELLYEFGVQALEFNPYDLDTRFHYMRAAWKLGKMDVAQSYLRSFFALEFDLYGEYDFLKHSDMPALMADVLESLELNTGLEVEGEWIEPSGDCSFAELLDCLSLENISASNFQLRAVLIRAAALKENYEYVVRAGNQLLSTQGFDLNQFNGLTEVLKSAAFNNVDGAPELRTALRPYL